MRKRTTFILALSTVVGIFALYIGCIFLTGNFHTVVKNEVYRSAQFGAGDVRYFTKNYNIKSIVNLRGENTGKPWYDSEVEEAKAQNVQLINYRMSAGHELTKEQAFALIEVMRDAPKPMLIHCMNGADRTSLASALYIAAINKGGEFSAELQLSPLYGHNPLWFTYGFAMNRTFEALEPYLGFPNS